MNFEIKTKWIEALSNNHYPQGRGYLLQKEGSSYVFDPLGVLCDLYASENEGTFSSVKELNYSFFLGEKDQLPELVMDWAELTSVDPKIKGEPISSIGDRGTSFQEIAKLIKEHL